MEAPHADRWRLIAAYEGSGAEQMAIDSWLLDQHVRGLQPPSLRFYTWQSPTISLGYHQQQFPARWNNLYYKGEKVSLVRRPTGGRAVLHHGDLTYALVTSGLSGSRRDVYQQLCQFLIEGWSKLGVELSFGMVGRDYAKSPNCFETATTADLVTDSNYKLIGSAQVYREGCVLQHGSIRLQPDTELSSLVFGQKISGKKISSDKASAEERALPNLHTKRLDHVLAALIRAASQEFEVEFEPQLLSAVEIEAATIAYLKTLN